jgi:hypothetical protein
VTEEPATEVSGALPPAPEPAGAPPPESTPPPPPPALEGLTQPVGAPPSLVESHPEILVGAAFLGGVVVATLIRRRGH